EIKIYKRKKKKQKLTLQNLNEAHQKRGFLNMSVREIEEKRVTFKERRMLASKNGGN
ncbi:unnamed protein product, partial [Dovyalis caffra]